MTRPLDGLRALIIEVNGQGYSPLCPTEVSIPPTKAFEFYHLACERLILLGIRAERNMTAKLAILLIAAHLRRASPGRRESS